MDALICEDGSYLQQGTAGIQTLMFLQKAFGRNCNGGGDWNGNGVIDRPYQLQGQQCLLFYLGGIPVRSQDGTIGFSGFSQNPANPAAPAVAGERRRGPYFQFATSRIALDSRYMAPSSDFPVYQDPYKVKGKNTVYAYFSAQGRNNWYSVSDCAAIAAQPYYQGISAMGAQYLNSSTFQIICAGEDGVFGGETRGPVPGAVFWQPLSGQIAGYGGGIPILNAKKQPSGNNDQTNFARGLLMAGQ